MKMPTPEENADLALASLDGLQRADVPPGLEEKLLARFDREFSVKAAPMATGWFWAAATVLLAVNIFAVVKYTSASKETAGIQEVASYYFTSNSLYQ